MTVVATLCFTSLQLALTAYVARALFQPASSEIKSRAPQTLVGKFAGTSTIHGLVASTGFLLVPIVVLVAHLAIFHAFLFQRGITT